MTAVPRVRRLAVHVLVGLFVLGCVGAGTWQLSRWGDRRAHNAILLERGSAPPLDGLDVSGEEAAYRRVRAVGRYDTANEVIARNRSLNGISGHHVVTPLVLADGRALIVDRGWVPIDLRDPPIAEAAPPAGEVVVEGVLVPSQTRGRFGPRDPAEGRLEDMARVDVPRLAQQLPYDVEPLYVQLAEQSPAPGEFPIPAPMEPLGEGPHLSYAIQWFLFAAAASVTYAAVLRRRAGVRGSS